ncbi:NUDIX hydrolase [Xanthobacter sp. TB0139]|uniref:NUDIX hydrolase n=1 Tax=Xanthobacter sp. TB0139 TaxID=3459178 RepID=UPI00403962FC
MTTGKASKGKKGISQFETSRPGRRVQYAALPYRVREDGRVQLRLITSRETRRWVIPKGWPMKGISPAKAAAREAYEEAGLLGPIAREALGIYCYEKRLAVRSVMCDVMVFPLKVKRQASNWPERTQREGFWFSVESAANAVQEEDLKLLILGFGDIMARKWEKKQAAGGKSQVKVAQLASLEVAEEEKADSSGQAKPVTANSNRQAEKGGKASSAPEKLDRKAS